MVEICPSMPSGNQAYKVYFYLKRCFVIASKTFIRVVGPLMILAANVLIGAVVFALLFYVIPQQCGDDYMKFGFHCIVGFYILANIEFNYAACVFTNPGNPKVCNDPMKYLGGSASVVDGKRVFRFPHKLQIEPAVSYRWCRHCKCIKPPRAHHDSITGTCVLDMDHFCPWMNNCIGYNNYRYFVLFMLYLFFGCIYVVILTACGLYQLQEIKTETSTESYAYLNNSLVYSFTIALSAGLSVAILLIWHFYLCVTNQTTIEFYINLEEKSDARDNNLAFKNPFDKGWRKNMMRVFGDLPWYKAGLISVREPPTQAYPFLPQAQTVV